VRTLIASQRRLRPSVPYASGYEFEDIVCAIDDADLLELEQVERAPSNKLTRKVASKIDRQFGLRISRSPRIKRIAVQSDYELFVARIMSPSEIPILSFIDGWQEKCRKKVLWIEELWPPMLAYPTMFRALADFDHIFVAHVPTVAPLEALVRVPCSFISPAVDALRFCPVPDPPVRRIDFMSMGRRSERTHEVLFEGSLSNPAFHYIFDTARLTEFTGRGGHTDHRELMASLIKRSKFFLSDRAKVDAPDQTAGSHVFGPRFFEGIGGGAVLVGEPPDCDTFRSYFDWPDAIVPMPHGSTEPFEIMTELVKDKGRMNRVHQANILNALERHDWLNRWKQILDTVEMMPAQGFEVRREQLKSRAELVRQAFAA
jgi:Glycosyl transferases group 1